MEVSFRNFSTEDNVGRQIFQALDLFVTFLLRKPRLVSELVQALLSFSLALGLNGLLTDVMKLIVGIILLNEFHQYFLL